MAVAANRGFRRATAMEICSYFSLGAPKKIGNVLT
jgi:hypothetical protein